VESDRVRSGGDGPRKHPGVDVGGDLVQSGKMRGLAVTGAKRLAGLPDVPTFAEAGLPGYAVTSWLGLAGPAGIPQPAIAKLNAEVVAILNEPDTIERLKKIGGEAKPTTADGFRSRVASDIEKWTKVVADAGIARI